MLEQRLVRGQTHPTLPLVILNYTERAAYDGVWNSVTRQCRGLIYRLEGLEVIARPFPKFFNYGQEGAPDLDLDAPAVVTEKLDGSLGILYRESAASRRISRPEYAIATRGSFASEQALHATEVWRKRYARSWDPHPELTYLFEIVYPSNRVVCDYGDTDDLFFLAALDTASGLTVSLDEDTAPPTPRVAAHPYRTLAEALAAEPRPGAEGLVVFLPDYGTVGERVKIKQADYAALHRILTGTNARNVWEYAAVRACRGLIADPKHWGSFLGIDPARAAELLAVGEDWLAAADVPDEFYGWVRETVAATYDRVAELLSDAFGLAWRARRLRDRSAAYELVRDHVFVREVMRFATAETVDALERAADGLMLRAWREAEPAPTAPFARTEQPRSARLRVARARRRRAGARA